MRKIIASLTIAAVAGFGLGCKAKTGVCDCGEHPGQSYPIGHTAHSPVIGGAPVGGHPIAPAPGMGAPIGGTPAPYGVPGGVPAGAPAGGAPAAMPAK